MQDDKSSKTDEDNEEDKEIPPLKSHFRQQFDSNNEDSDSNRDSKKNRTTE